MSFKEYRKKKKEHQHPSEKEKLPSLETIFGSHAIEKGAEKLAAMETKMGSHSGEKSLKEDTESVHMTQDAEEIHNNLAPIHDLSEDERMAVKNYSDHSTFINNALHQHYKYGHIPAKTLKIPESLRDTALLDSVLSRHKTKDDFTVYTGVKKSPSTYFKDPERKVKVHLPAFTSTTTDRHVATHFASGMQEPADEDHGIDSSVENHHILKIRVPKGTHAMSLVKHSWMPGEQEILLHRGHNLVIHPNPEYVGNNTYHWHAEIHSHDPEEIKKD